MSRMDGAVHGGTLVRFVLWRCHLSCDENRIFRDPVLVDGVIFLSRLRDDVQAQLTYAVSRRSYIPHVMGATWSKVPPSTGSRARV